MTAAGPAPDRGGLGSMSTAKLSLLTKCGTFFFFSIFLMLLLLLLSAVCPTRYASPVGGWMAALLIIGHSFVRLVPLLWSQPGRLTFVRVNQISHVLLPHTPKGCLCGGMLLLDLVLIPLCIGSCVFDRSVVLALPSTFLYAPPIHSSVFFYLLFWTVPIIAILINLAFFIGLSIERHDPFIFSNNPNKRKMFEYLAFLSAALMVPSFTFLLSAIPCDKAITAADDNYHMRYAANTECLSRAHRAHLFFAMFFLEVIQIVLDVSIGALHRLKDAHSASTVQEPTSDMLFFELMRFFRLLAVVLVTAQPSVLHCFMISVISSLLLLWLLMGNLASSVECVQQGYMVVLGCLATCALAAAGIKLIVGEGWLPALIWTVVWVASVCLALYKFHDRFQVGFEVVG